MKNLEVRTAAKSAGVKLGEIAEVLGITDGNFSRKLRRELPRKEQEQIIGIINEIAAEREGTA